MSQNKNTMAKDENNKRRDSVMDNKLAKDNKTKAMITEIAELKAAMKKKEEEIMEIKMEKTTAVNMMTNLQSMDSIREELRMADMFFKMMMKENLMDYRETAINKDEENKKIKIKKTLLKDNSSNRFQCKCSACIVNLKAYDNNFSVKAKKVTKHICISSMVLMSLTYNPSQFEFENFKMEDNMKKLLLKKADINTGSIEMNFTVSKSKEMEMEMLNFSKNKIITLEQFVEKASISSMIVVESMRNMSRINPASELAILESVTLKEGINDCFYETMKNFLPNMEYRVNLHCINDMTIEEEMLMLTNYSMEKVYINNKVEKNKKNHMSVSSFDNSIEIYIHMLVTPMFRDVMFFGNSDNESDFDFGNDFETRSLNSENETSSDTQKKGFPHVLSDSDKRINFKGNFNIPDLIKIRSHTYKSDLFEAHYKMFKTQRESVEMYKMSNISKILDTYDEKSYEMLSVIHITLEEFKLIYFFLENPEDISTMVYVHSLRSWDEMVSCLPMFMNYITTKILNKKREDVVSTVMNFVISMDKMADINSNMIKKLFNDLKMRAMNFYKMRAATKFLASHRLDNREYFMSLIDRTDDFDETERFRFSLIKNESNIKLSDLNMIEAMITENGTGYRMLELPEFKDLADLFSSWRAAEILRNNQWVDDNLENDL